MKNMAGYAKGTRKPKGGFKLGDIELGGYVIKPELAVTALLAALYILFLLGSSLESGSDALILSLFSFIIFGAFAYMVRTPSLVGLRPFAKLIDAFLALSALTLLAELAVFLNLLSFGGDIKPLAMTVTLAISSIILIGCMLYLEKGKLKDIYVRAGNLASLTLGVAGLIAGILLGVGVLYILFNNVAPGMGQLPSLLAVAIAFSIIGAFYEELWFRGLLLSRLMPLLGEKRSNIMQALIFGVFEALAIYAITLQPIYLPLVFIAGTALGYYLGKITIKDKRLISAILLHAGFYALIGISILAGIK